PTAALGASVSPYTIDFYYPGSTNFTSADDQDQTLTITPAVPSFSNLSAPTITYGTATTTLGGQLAAPTATPLGLVSITVDNTTILAPIDVSGNFSADFDTAALGVAGSPHSITYSFAGDDNFTAVQDCSQTLTVDPAVPQFGSLTPSITITYGTDHFTLSGRV